MAKLKAWNFFSVWMILVLIVGLGVVIVPASPVEAQTNYYVSTTGNDGNDGTAPDDAHAWLTIQHAADNVTAGDTINVAAGTYNEKVDVTKANLTVRSTPTGGAVIDVSSLTESYVSEPAVRIGAAGVTFDGFQVVGSDQFNQGTSQIRWGIYVWQVDGCTVSNNTVRDISVESWVGAGIVLYRADSNTITGNTCTSNRGDGIDLCGFEAYSSDGSDNNAISGNTCTNNGWNGVILNWNCSGNTVDNNPALNDNRMGICIARESDLNSFTGNTASGNSVAGVYIQERSAWNTLTGNVLTGNCCGVLVWDEGGGDPHDNAIHFNNIVGNVGGCTWNGGGTGVETLVSGIHNSPTVAALVDAENNWWGANDGPSGVGLGSGDAVSTNVDYTPWLTRSEGTPSATGSGTVTFGSDAGGITGLTAVAEATLPAIGKPAGVTFPHGLFSFNIIGIIPGSCVTVTITYPAPIPVGAQYWKYQNGNWIDCTSLLGGDDGDNVLTLMLCDGGLGDADGVPDGTIVDPGGPATLAPAQAGAQRASPAPPRSLTPAQMSLQYLSITPQQTSAGQPVTITTNVVNTGDEAGNYNVALKINGQLEQSRMVSVGPQGTQPVKFTVTKAQPGTYTVDIGGRKGSFVVLGAGAGVNGGLIALLIMGVLVLATIVVLIATRRRTA